mmetsp:Transcript_34163/g.85180  ORF Transcript_34163/g.85180 Transcript_34163/m.85180 type:complete len:242 (-) Transcript_34163:873-1598(-)
MVRLQEMVSALLRDALVEQECREHEGLRRYDEGGVSIAYPLALHACQLLLRLRLGSLRFGLKRERALQLAEQLGLQLAQLCADGAHLLGGGGQRDFQLAYVMRQGVHPVEALGIHLRHVSLHRLHGRDAALRGSSVFTRMETCLIMLSLENLDDGLVHHVQLLRHQPERLHQLDGHVVPHFECHVLHRVVRRPRRIRQLQQRLHHAAQPLAHRQVRIDRRRHHRRLRHVGRRRPHEVALGV